MPASVFLPQNSFVSVSSSFKKLRYESKMAMAASLLESESIIVNECARRCGYTSLSSFTAAFKHKFNLSPNEYKKAYKK